MKTTKFETEEKVASDELAARVTLIYKILTAGGLSDDEVAEAMAALHYRCCLDQGLGGYNIVVNGLRIKMDITKENENETRTH